LSYALWWLDVTESVVLRNYAPKIKTLLSSEDFCRWGNRTVGL